MACVRDGMGVGLVREPNWEVSRTGRVLALVCSGEASHEWPTFCMELVGSKEWVDCMERGVLEWEELSHFKNV